MPEADAISQFGDMQTMSGVPEAQTDLIASTTMLPQSSGVHLTATLSTTTPYDTQCASVSYQGGVVSGYGC